MPRHPNKTTGHRLAGRGFRHDTGAPSSSWWTEAVSFESFREIAKSQIPRMQTSKFHRLAVNDGTALYAPSKRATE